MTQNASKKVFELAVGDVINLDEGEFVVCTTPRYQNNNSYNMIFMACPTDYVALKNWKEMSVEDNAKVFVIKNLERQET
jgi:hypothetical protein